MTTKKKSGKKVSKKKASKKVSKKKASKKTRRKFVPVPSKKDTTVVVVIPDKKRGRKKASKKKAGKKRVIRHGRAYWDKYAAEHDLSVRSATGQAMQFGPGRGEWIESMKVAQKPPRKKAAKKKAGKKRAKTRYHKPPTSGVAYGPLPRKAERTARRFAKKGVAYSAMRDSYFKSKAPKRKKAQKKVATVSAAQILKSAHVKSTRTVTKGVTNPKTLPKKATSVSAEQIMKRANAKSGKLSVWLCANKGPRTGCGGGKRGGHVMGVLA